MKYRLIPLLIILSIVFIILSFGCSIDDNNIINTDDDTINDSTNSTVPDSSFIFTTDTLVSFEFFQDSNIITISNRGRFTETYFIEFGSTYFSTDTLSGTITPLESLHLDLILDRSQIPSDTLPQETYLLISTEDTLIDSIPIFISNYATNLWHLGFHLLDAEYCRAIDRIIAISDEPHKLHLINPSTKEIQSMDLPHIPRAVTIRFDGKFAAVGHYGYISYIDIINWEIVKILAAPDLINQILLPSNGWVYTFPRERAIEISSGLQLNPVGNTSSSIYARLHPSENYIYGANNGVHPSDFEKYDIRNDTIYVMYDSPYHSSFKFEGNVWISEDGLRLYSKGGYVFTSSEIQSEDMVMIGNFTDGKRGVVWVDQSNAAGRVYLIGFNQNLYTIVPNNLYVLENEDLSYLGTVPLPKNLIRDINYKGVLSPAYGRFVFANNGGTELYVLAFYRDESNQIFDWTIQTHQITDLP